MIINTDDYIKQKFLDKFDLSSVGKKNKDFKNFKKNKNKIINKDIKKFANNVNNKFIDKICNDRYNKVVFYGMNYYINISEIAGVCVYRRILETKGKKDISKINILLNKAIEIKNEN